MLSTSNPLLHSAILNLDVENCKDLLKDNKISDINEFAELIRDILITPKINEYRSSFDRAVQILDVFLDQGLSLDVYKLPEDIFHRLLMEYPETTYKVIDDFQKINKDSFPNYVEFLKKNLHAMLYSYSVLGFRDENGPAFKKISILFLSF